MDDSHPLDYYPDAETGDEGGDALVLIDKARAFLARAETLPEIGDVMAVAERARRWAKRAKLGREAENHAARIRIEAERKAGALLAEAPKNPGGLPEQATGRIFRPVEDRVPKLSDLGISKQQSSDWQRMAKVPDEIFAAHVEEIVAAKRPLSTVSVVEIARRIEKAERGAELKLIILPESIPARVEVADAGDLPLDDASVDLIVTSPPYGLDIGYESGDVEPIEWAMILKNWLLEARRVTKPHGRLALNIPLDTSSPFPRPTYAEALHAALWAGWQYRFTIIWDEGNTSKGNRSLGSVNSSARPHHISPVEMIPVFSNGEWGPTSDGRDDITPDEWQAWGRGIWSFSGESSAWEGHPAAFPLELPRRLIRYLCRVGDVVLDPFVGSGTTVLAAIQLGRQAIGVDRSQQYVDSTLRRLATHGARPGAVGTPSTGAGVPGTRAETGESGGLRSGLDRGARGAPEHERLPAGATGVAV